MEWTQVEQAYPKLPKEVQDRLIEQWSGKQTLTELLPLLNQILSLLDDAYLESEGLLQSDIFRVWQMLNYVVEQHKQ